MKLSRLLANKWSFRVLAAGLTGAYLVVPITAVWLYLAWAAQSYVLPTGSTEHQTEHLTNLPNRDEALRSCFSGTAAPTSPTPVDGQCWYDETNDIYYRRINGSWVPIATLLANTYTGTPQAISNATNPTFQATDSTNTVSAVLRAFDTEGRVGTSTNHPACVETNGTCRATWDTSGNLTNTGTITGSALTASSGGDLTGTGGADHTASTACASGYTRVGLWCHYTASSPSQLRGTATDDFTNVVNVTVATSAKVAIVGVHASAQDAGSTTTTVLACAGDPDAFTGCQYNSAEMVSSGASAKGLGTGAYAMDSTTMIVTTNSSGQIATQCQIASGIDEGQCFWNAIAYLD